MIKDQLTVGFSYEFALVKIRQKLFVPHQVSRCSFYSFPEGAVQFRRLARPIYIAQSGQTPINSKSKLEQMKL